MPNIECIFLKDRSTVTPPASAVLCLGNFDGVHLAHQALIREAKALRDRIDKDAVCGVFCFREPSWLFLSNDPPKKLCSLSQKLEAFYKAGAEYAYLADFPSIAALSPADFLKNILKHTCHAVGAVCGYNYRFGAKGAGTPNDLYTFFGDHTVVEQAILKNGDVVSSSRIRAYLKNGEIAEANALMGRPFSLSATVLHGKSLGKKLGAPTANQVFSSDILVPKHGVYVTRCRVDGVCYRCVSNIGIRPTVDSNAAVNCETYLIGFQGDLYGRELTVEFLDFLRCETRFSSTESLAKQIQADIEAARNWQQTEDFL